MSNTRVYKVDITASNVKGSEHFTESRLIRATNQSRALSHALKDSVVISVCSTDDAVALGAAGVEIEDAEATEPAAAA